MRNALLPKKLTRPTSKNGVPARKGNSAFSKMNENYRLDSEAAGWITMYAISEVSL